MSRSIPELSPHFFEARDGARLAYRELGAGRPVVLIHGFFSTATVNWVRYGHAEKIAASGFRVIMPDLRGHGDSAKPHDPAAYPPDVLTDDALTLVETLGLDDFDLGGYSLGARTTVRMLARGAAPRRAVVAGMGLEGILDSRGRGEFFRRILVNPGSFPRGSAEWMAEAFLKTVGGDPVALLAVLDTAVDTPAEMIARIRIPTLVAAGAEDRDNGSAAALAEAFEHGRYLELPGNHMSAVAKPELGAAIVDFLEQRA
ncbi:MAG: alpha/beta fold hydrolase [Steroidobacteraceae bacterium]|jgi:pimeloyl-ACP methyl ester carboxylesterase